ncbi:MAG: glutaminyl-peptide cyclotransferase [Nevskia sp.]|nr:glutaminyl-peptide cyclotransferase [Nevskia sp.]
MRIVAALGLAVAAATLAQPLAQAPLLHWRLVAEYPHDATAFTEGLVVDGKGRLIESAGRYGESRLVMREVASGRVLKTAALPKEVFGEGIAIAGKRIVQLTWREQVGFLYDLDLKPLGRFSYAGEGWGLTYDGHRLIQSDGSALLYFMDPQTFREAGHVSVHDGATAIEQLNELEYANGLVYANVWHSDRIAAIEPDSGEVRGWLDLSPLEQRLQRPPNWDPEDDVLNGIAHDPHSGHFYVTGKRWPKLFEIAVETEK